MVGLSPTIYAIVFKIYTIYMTIVNNLTGVNNMVPFINLDLRPLLAPTRPSYVEEIKVAKTELDECGKLNLYGYDKPYTLPLKKAHRENIKPPVATVTFEQVETVLRLAAEIKAFITLTGKNNSEEVKIRSFTLNSMRGGYMGFELNLGLSDNANTILLAIAKLVNIFAYAGLNFTVTLQYDFGEITARIAMLEISSIRDYYEFKKAIRRSLSTSR